MGQIYHSPKEKKAFAGKAAVVIVLFAVVLVAMFFGLKFVDGRRVTGSGAEASTEDDGKLTWNGVNYRRKENIETYLFMGVDEDGKAGACSEEETPGQSDVLKLMVLDRSTGRYQTLTIDRDTMTDVKSLNYSGELLATTKIQIALAHANGNGLETSCENVVDAVSNYLGGCTIDGYCAVNMSAIQVMNHLAGGVEVTIEDDFSESDPTLKIGETLVLSDEQAVHYVHDRMNVGDGTNENRMARQDNYVAGLREKLGALCKEDANYPLEIYDGLSEYMVTNISRKKFAKLALKAIQDKTDGEAVIEGEHTIGEDELVEFTPDEDSLMEAIVTLFYEEDD